MERSLLWFVFTIGWACWLSGFLLTRRRRLGTAGIAEALPRPYLAAAIGLPLLLFLATLPSRPPLFAPGHDLGNGFLLGGIGALLSGLVLIQGSLSVPGERSLHRTAATVASPFALGVALTAAPLLLPSDTLQIALLGVGIGWLSVTVVLLLGLIQNRKEDQERPELLPMIAGVGFVALLCATTTLGDDHGKVTFIATSTEVSWAVIGLVFAAGIPFFLLLSTLPETLIFARNRANSWLSPLQQMQGRMLRTGFALLGMAILGRLLSQRVADATLQVDTPKGPFGSLLSLIAGPSRLFHLIGIGLIIGLIVWWVSAAWMRQDQEGENTGAGWQNGALGILVVLVGTMVAYQILAGFGIGLMLLGVWSMIGLGLLRAQEPAAREAAKQTDNTATRVALQLVRLGIFGAMLALYRLYTTQFEGDMPRLAYTDQYAVCGFLAGVALPLLLGGFLLRSRADTPTSPLAQLFRLCVTGALLLSIPSYLLLLWGQKCVIALLIGLALTVVEIGQSSSGDILKEMLGKLIPALMALGIGLALNEWADRILPMADWTRVQKEHVLIQLVGILIVLVLAADYGGRLAAWRKGPKVPGVAPKGAAQ